MHQAQDLRSSTAVYLCFVVLLACEVSAFGVTPVQRPAKQASPGQSGAALTGKLVVFHAGSLSIPFREISRAFNQLHPKLKIYLEAAGSRTCARKITDLNRRCDVMGSADYTVINQLLIPDHAAWNIRFVANEMVIAYHSASRYADQIAPHNWFHLLLNERVIFGRSDPNADPCGYRAVMTIKLAQQYYQLPALAERMLAKDLNFIRPKETDLLGLLESNSIDYIFLYRSVSQQHGLKYVLLPDQINLKNPALSDLYAQTTVKISGKKPGEFITKKGTPMVYGITIPRNAPNPRAALAFVQYVLSKDKGIRILEALGQPSVIPSVSASYDQIPDELKVYAMKPVQEKQTTE